jgi:hypothetical protein
MNESDLQRLLDSYTINQGNNPLNQLIEPLLPLLSLFFIIGIILTIVVIIVFVVGAVQKHRTHAAILRIDKNLQRLVDAQLPPKEITDSAVEASKQ